MKIRVVQKVIDKVRNKKTFQQMWRERNQHNGLDVLNEFNLNNVNVGKGTYGSISVISYGYPKEKLSIGNYCSFALGTTFFLSSGHDICRVSTYPFRKFYLNEEFECESKGEIIVEDDVWIGDKVTVMPGVRIGQGAVIALGSVVTKDVEPYSVVGGVPARFIKYRFENSIIEKLKTIDYSKIDKNFVLEHPDSFNMYITVNNVDELIKEFPKR